MDSESNKLMMRNRMYNIANDDDNNEFWIKSSQFEDEMNAEFDTCYDNQSASICSILIHIPQSLFVFSPKETSKRRYSFK